ncbi:hypothetical protein CEUSTIGMA_g10597.t1 [Chlamydomonas eustigma]|uniref:Pentacotripeptide-repeat region of PRORP domain-containing protein n=1 Tax=Chlamydomonas eustigma TaxID=1157962 RepID=A0A250XJA5_9CHLO|nr:hypothetical protein CEUSTIGMA_g10597.t1 [Chlamydomonas eustigma]|eukprot:GAX83171.1 hypothetical protein CEUSTIGMA_g10597.t1 [Chlamydomonas eustigma]
MVFGVLRAAPSCSGPSSTISSTRSRHKDRKNARSTLDIPLPRSPLVTCQGKIHRLEVESASSSSVSSSVHQSELQIIQAPAQSLNDFHAMGLQAMPAEEELPHELQQLLDPHAPVLLPTADTIRKSPLNNRKLDRLVSKLGRSKDTWRRSLVLFEWLKTIGHVMDDRLTTTVMRLCADNGDPSSALAIYNWMQAPAQVGGAGLSPSIFTYTAAMRASISARLPERAMQIWLDAEASGVEPDCRMCVAYMEACVRLGQCQRALSVYTRMRSAPSQSAMCPSVHAYTVAMRAACEDGKWERALDIWVDMRDAGCEPTGHAYAAAISACATGGDWMRAVSLFEEMASNGVQPDVVSCTALVTALASSGEADKAEAVIKWMLRNKLTPNVRTYSSLITCMGNAKQWNRAVEVLKYMQLPEWGSVQPNAYTYSAVLKILGEHGQWKLAEAVFGQVEQQVLVSRMSDHMKQRISSIRVVNPGSKEFTAPQSLGQGMRNSPINDVRTPVLRHEHMETSRSTQGSALPLLTGTFSRQDISGEGSSHFESNGVASQKILEMDPLHLKEQLHIKQLSRSLEQQQTTQKQSPLTPATNILNSRHGKLNKPRPSSASKDVLSFPVTLDDPELNPIQGIECTPDLLSSSNGGHGESKVTPGQHTYGVPLLNEVVCGAMMLVYERAGMWAEAVHLLSRARNMGIKPNTVMYNTAISASAKSGQVALAERLLEEAPEPDAISHETVVAAYGVCGKPKEAEAALLRMRKANFKPRDYAWCGLIAAYSLTRDIESALAVQRRIKQEGGTSSVHVYNALLAACERDGQKPEVALSLINAMTKEGIKPNALTQRLMGSVGRQGVEVVEGQQAALAAISAAVAAAGGILIHKGVF